MIATERVTHLIFAAAREADLMPETVLKSQSPTPVAARWAIWQHLRNRGFSTTEIGKSFGVGHSTIIHATKNAAKAKGPALDVYNRVMTKLQSYKPN